MIQQHNEVVSEEKKIDNYVTSKSAIEAFVLSRKFGVVFGLCLFIFLLSFKPSEPYLSQFLICNYNTQSSFCDSILLSDQTSSSICNVDENPPCSFSGGDYCSPLPCQNITSKSDCGNSDYSYCIFDTKSNKCKDDVCYKHFTADEVNNEIYVWSTYAYLPFLLFLGPYAEMFSYRTAILVGISGRVVTRFLLLYGTSISTMQIMQVTYALGTAAEDVFSAYIYYVVSPSEYEKVTSYVKASALVASLLSGVLGDLVKLVYLVVEGSVSVTVLMYISAMFVCAGFAVGLYVITKRNTSSEGMLASMSNPLHTSMNRLSNENRKDNFNSVRIDDEEEESITLRVDTPPQKNVCEHADTLSGWQRRRARISATLSVFALQLRVLRLALHSKPLLALLGLWICGNAVFTTFYGYEVSIYDELNGSNSWNGSVLAAILLAGSAGAMLPAWISLLGPHTSSSNQEPDTTQSLIERSDALSDRNTTMIVECPSPITPPLTQPTDIDNHPDNKDSSVSPSTLSDQAVCVRVLAMCVVSSAFLVGYVRAWEVVASMCCLAGFFACWQFVNVVCLARLATQLKTAQLSLLQQEPGFPSIIADEAPEPPYSVAFVLVIALNVCVQVVFDSVIFSYLQLDLHAASWVLVWVFVSGCGGFAVACVGLFGPRSRYIH